MTAPHDTDRKKIEDQDESDLKTARYDVTASHDTDRKKVEDQERVN